MTTEERQKAISEAFYQISIKFSNKLNYVWYKKNIAFHAHETKNTFIFALLLKIYNDYVHV